MEDLKKTLEDLQSALEAKRAQKEKEEESAVFKDQEIQKKSLFKAYLWLVLGGFVGGHHMYLGNDYKAILMIATVGGCYGLGILVDLFYLPRYVEQANRHPYWRDLQKLEMKHFPKPRWNWGMVLYQLIVGALFRSLVHMAIPFKEYLWLRFFLLPVASSAGIWLVGKTYNLNSSFKSTLFGSYLSHILFFQFLGISISYFPFDTSLGAVIMYLKSPSCRYNLQPNSSRISDKKKRKFAATLVIMLTLQGCYYYSNATVMIEGMPVPLRDLLFEFFNSSAWAETKVALAQFYDEVWVIGILPALNRLATWGGDGISEEAAYLLLDVPQNISSAHLKKRYRALSLQYHPDKQAPEDREQASNKFIQLKAAYEVIIKMRTYRTKIESAKLLKEVADRLNRVQQKHRQKDPKSEL